LIALYNLLLILLVVVSWPLLLIVALSSPRLRQGLGERLRPLQPMADDCLWVHAASVGEAEAAAPLVRQLLDHGLSLLATTMTVTGRERLRARFPELPVRLAPLDLPGLAGASVRRARVRGLVLIETEIWPNAIAATRAAGGAVFIVSGRISDSGFRRYRRFRRLFAAVLERVEHVAARSPEDLERFVALGVTPGRASLGGDLKLDRDPPAPADEALCEAIGGGPMLVGGSTHPGEEEALLAAWRGLAERLDGLRLILVPRHPERIAEVRQLVERQGIRVGLRSEGAATAPVVVVDTMGELPALYQLADWVFVGGSLAPVGGHNLLEPVEAGRVIVHGPHLHNQRTQAQLLEPLGVLHPVHDARELELTVERLAAAPDPHAPARAARAVLESHRGASRRAAELILEGLRG
jgi:3-deoxy-D-manno-octulosonic-acid transferase